MIFTSCGIPGAFVIDLERREDERGFFARVWCADELSAQGITERMTQINIGVSHTRGTLRGVHYQRAPHAECKIVQCPRGGLFDVLVDLRTDSPTHCQWFGVELSESNRRALVIPEGCAHGFLTLQDDTEMMCTTSHVYAPQSATGVRFDDPAFAIRWPLAPTLLSEQDRSWPDYCGTTGD